VDRLEAFVIEASAGMTDIAPRLALPHGKRERAEKLARTPRTGEADDDRLLLVYGLNFEPFARTTSGVIAAVSPLGDDPLEGSPLCCSESANAVAPGVSFDNR
jgi:hypothetical protein